MNLMLKHTITVSAVLLAVSAVGLLVAPKQMMQHYLALPCVWHWHP